MKPNILIVQPSPADGDSSIDHFCEALSKTHYVYLIRPIDGFREDSPAGVRFLNFSPERLPGFGEVESIILVDGAEHAPRLQEAYPTARQWLWNRNPDGGDLTSLVALDRDTIIQGGFADADSRHSRARCDLRSALSLAAIRRALFLLSDSSSASPAPPRQTIHSSSKLNSWAHASLSPKVTGDRRSWRCILDCPGSGLSKDLL